MQTIKSRPRRYGEKGFTLVEVLVAAAIGAILISGALYFALQKDREYRTQQEFEHLSGVRDTILEAIKSDIAGAVKIGPESGLSEKSPPSTWLSGVMPACMGQGMQCSLTVPPTGIFIIKYENPDQAVTVTSEEIHKTDGTTEIKFPSERMLSTLVVGDWVMLESGQLNHLYRISGMSVSENPTRIILQNIVNDYTVASLNNFRSSVDTKANVRIFRTVHVAYLFSGSELYRIESRTPIFGSDPRDAQFGTPVSVTTSITSPMARKIATGIKTLNFSFFPCSGGGVGIQRSNDLSAYATMNNIELKGDVPFTGCFSSSPAAGVVNYRSANLIAIAIQLKPPNIGGNQAYRPKSALLDPTLVTYVYSRSRRMGKEFEGQVTPRPPVATIASLGCNCDDLCGVCRAREEAEAAGQTDTCAQKCPGDWTKTCACCHIQAEEYDAQDVDTCCPDGLCGDSQCLNAFGEGICGYTLGSEKGLCCPTCGGPLKDQCEQCWAPQGSKALCIHGCETVEVDGVKPWASACCDADACNSNCPIDTRCGSCAEPSIICDMGEACIGHGKTAEQIAAACCNSKSRIDQRCNLEKCPQACDGACCGGAGVEGCGAGHYKYICNFNDENSCINNCSNMECFNFNFRQNNLGTMCQKCAAANAPGYASPPSDVVKRNCCNVTTGEACYGDSETGLLPTCPGINDVNNPTRCSDGTVCEACNPACPNHSLTYLCTHRFGKLPDETASWLYSGAGQIPWLCPEDIKVDVGGETKTLGDACALTTECPGGGTICDVTTYEQAQRCWINNWLEQHPGADPNDYFDDIYYGWHGRSVYGQAMRSLCENPVYDACNEGGTADGQMPEWRVSACCNLVDAGTGSSATAIQAVLNEYVNGNSSADPYFWQMNLRCHSKCPAEYRSCLCNLQISDFTDRCTLPAEANPLWCAYASDYEKIQAKCGIPGRCEYYGQGTSDTQCIRCGNPPSPYDQASAYHYASNGVGDIDVAICEMCGRSGGFFFNYQTYTFERRTLYDPQTEVGVAACCRNCDRTEEVTAYGYAGAAISFLGQCCEFCPDSWRLQPEKCKYIWGDMCDPTNKYAKPEAYCSDGCPHDGSNGINWTLDQLCDCYAYASGTANNLVNVARNACCSIAKADDFKRFKEVYASGRGRICDVDAQGFNECTGGDFDQHCECIRKNQLEQACDAACNGGDINALCTCGKESVPQKPDNICRYCCDVNQNVELQTLYGCTQEQLNALDGDCKNSNEETQSGM